GSLLLAALGDGTAKLWDWRTGCPACPPLAHAAEVVDAYFLNGAWVVTAAADGDVRVWDRRDGRAVTVGLKSPRCHGAALVGDGRTLVIGCSGGVAVLHDLADLTIPIELPADELDRLA